MRLLLAVAGFCTVFAAHLDARAGEIRSLADNLPAKTEVGVVPLFGGNSDVGIGGGALGSVARVEPGVEPYHWRIESAAIVTFKPPADAGWRVPYQDYYVLFVVPELVPKRLRLEVRPSYTRESTQLYYGVGNAAPAPATGPEGQSESDYFQYGRMHPTLLARVRLALGGPFSLLLGDAITYDKLDVHPGSRLDRDLTSPSDAVRPFVGTAAPHFVNLFEQALLYDTRDNETSPTSGMYHQVKLRLSPGGSEAFPYRYGQVNAIARFYATPFRNRLSINLRIVGDGQFGHPPFYELARYEDTFALGGVHGVRGVPAQRYYGKVKLFANLEVRTELTSFELWKNDFEVGAAIFFDGGRLWSDWTGDPALDGSGAGLKYGVGCGLRLRQGRAFVVRGDVAWSPDARPIAGYFTAGHTF